MKNSIIREDIYDTYINLSRKFKVHCPKFVPLDRLDYLSLIKEYDEDLIWYSLWKISDTLDDASSSSYIHRLKARMHQPDMMKKLYEGNFKWDLWNNEFVTDSEIKRLSDK